jgi:hypothetical protein
MKRYVILFAVLAAMVACALFGPPSPVVIPGVTVTLEAQTLPITRTMAWDQPNAATEGVTHYVVRLDGTVIGSPTSTTQPITITALGSHTLTVVAVNFWGESPPGTLTVNVVAPSAPSGLRIQ